MPAVVLSRLLSSSRAASVLSAGHARALLGVADAGQQDRLAQRVVAEGISVRALEEIVAVGDVTGDTPRPRKARPKAPGLTELSERLADRLETRVKIDLGKAKGKITVEFANTGDLQRIVDLIEALTYGREWQIGHDKLPPLPWWLVEIAYRLIGHDAALGVGDLLAAGVPVGDREDDLAGREGRDEGVHLRQLYEKSKDLQWNARTLLPWARVQERDSVEDDGARRRR